jgi:hypothetical protein
VVDIGLITSYIIILTESSVQQLFYHIPEYWEKTGEKKFARQIYIGLLLITPFAAI